MKTSMLWLTVLVAILLTLVACGPRQSDLPDTPDLPEIPNEPSAETEGFSLSETEGYCVVVSEFSSKDQETAARLVRNAIEAAHGKKPKLSSDWLTDAPTPEEVASWREILVGKVDRIECKDTLDDLDGVGYTIRAVGNKLVIVGVDDMQTLKAVDYFTEVILPAHTHALAADFNYTEQYEARLVTSLYPTDSPVVAEVVATDLPYRADPTGKTDSTFAIQAAIDECESRGGGTVYLPAGEYLVTSTVYVASGVVLRGDWQDPDTVEAGKAEYGTVILARPDPLEDHERDDLSAKPLMNLLSNSGAVGLTFYYPDQNAQNPIPYGYTVHSYSNNTATVRDITLLNSYRGVGASLSSGDTHCIMQLESLRICALESGVEMDGSRDVGYTVDVRVSPSYWSEAGGNYRCQDATALKKFCRENAVGITIKALDDEHFSTLSVEGCRTGIHIAQPVNGAAYWGLIYDVTVEDCTYGIIADAVNDYGGISLARATIDADEYAILSRSPKGAIKLCGIELTGTGDVVATNGARIIWDRETDVSDYEVDYGDYDRPADHMYVAPVKRLSASNRDISVELQTTLDEAGKTGGVVYLPAGFYTLTAPVTVPAGVELRGATDIYVYSHVESEVCGTILFNYVDDGAAITLKDGAGVNAMTIFSPAYDPTYALELIEEGDDVVEEAVTVRGEGDGVYVIHTTLLGNFIGIDFSDCDDHLIREAFGCTFNTFARVGGKGGVVDRVMNTFHMIDRNPLVDMGYTVGQRCNVPAWTAVHDYEPEAISTLRDDLLRTHYNVIEIVGAENEQVSNVFMFTPSRIVYTERASATLLNISSDAHGLNPMFEITDGSDVVAVNALRSGGRSLRVDGNSTFKLFNRIAISDWYEPGFDSTRGDAQERTFTEYRRLDINDGNADGIVGVTQYHGSEFSKSGGSSMYYTSNVDANVDQVFFDTFDAVDLTDFMTEDGYLHLWVYIEDLTDVWWSGYIQVESSTSGHIRWSTSTSLRLHGWNELYLPLTGAVEQGRFDPTHVTAVRMTNQVGTTLEHPDMYIDDIYFTLAKIDQGVELWPQSTVGDVRPSSPLRENVPSAPVIFREIVEGKLSLFDCETVDGSLMLNKAPDYVKEGKASWRIAGAAVARVFEPVDISTLMEDGYLHLWVYVGGNSYVKGGQIELSSSGGCDVQELSWNASSYVTKQGWNELKLSFTNATMHSGEPFDPTRLNYFRIYLQTADGSVPRVYLDDIYIIDETPDEGSDVTYEGMKTQEFTVGEASESVYLGDKKGSFTAGKSTVRYADKTNEIIYKYSVAVTPELSRVAWIAKVGQQLHLQVSLDGANWKTVYCYDGPPDDHGLAITEREYDLRAALGSLLGSYKHYVTVYVKVCDASTDTGWGGAISVDAPVRLELFYGEYIPEQAPDGPEIPSEDPSADTPVGEYDRVQHHTFTVNTEREGQYLTADRGSFIQENGKSRYADKHNKIVYAYPISDRSTLSRLVWIAPVGQQLHLQVSLNGTDWVDVYRYEGEASDVGLPILLRGYDLLTPIADQLGEESRRGTLYVKIADAYTDSGWGGAIGTDGKAMLIACYGEVSAADDPLLLIRKDGTVDADATRVITQTMPLLDTECIPDGVTGVALNTDPAYVKKGSASYRHDGGHVWLQVAFAEPVDISDYVEDGYLHLWVYVGDTPLSYKDGQIEIGSGGREDVSEWCWYINAHVTQAGWNELYLPFAGAHNGREPLIDPTAINFMRIYCITEDGTRPTVYLDDIYVCK